MIEIFNIWKRKKKHPNQCSIFVLEFLLRLVPNQKSFFSILHRRPSNHPTSYGSWCDHLRLNWLRTSFIDQDKVVYAITRDLYSTKLTIQQIRIMLNVKRILSPIQFAYHLCCIFCIINFRIEGKLRSIM